MDHEPKVTGEGPWRWWCQAAKWGAAEARELRLLRGKLRAERDKNTALVAEVAMRSPVPLIDLERLPL